MKPLIALNCLLLAILAILVSFDREIVIQGSFERLGGILTAYSSEESQTDSEPEIMASGKRVYEGAIANNCHPFGTKVEINGKIYVVEDRKNSRYGCEWWDIWFENTELALEWGIQKHEILVYK